MKKLFTLLCLAAGFTMNAQAQSDGFYHVQNTLTGRYALMVDNSKGGTSGAGNIDMKSLQTCLDLNIINKHPGAVVYLQSLGGTYYDVAAQGTSISKLSNNALKPQIKSEAEGYVVFGTYSNVTVYLGDATNMKDGSDTEYKTWSYVKEAGSKNRYWKFYPIDNNTHYLGIEPDCKDGDGNYWGSLYFGFAFKCQSSGMEVYYVDGVNDNNFSLKKWTNSVVPATMPVIIKCSSSNPANNMIKPVTDSATEPSDNKLTGCYFDNTESNHVNKVDYNSSTMRVIDVKDGKLVFAKASSSYLTGGAYMPHNKVWLNVSSSASSTLSEGTVGIESVMKDIETGDDAIYTLTGVRLPENVTPRPGIYLKNGKKVVIR